MADPIGHLERVRALAVCGPILAVGGARASVASAVALYDHAAEERKATVLVPAHVHALAATDTSFVAACEDGHLRVIAANGGAILADIPVLTGACTAVAVQGSIAAVAGADGAVRRVSLADGQVQRAFSVSHQPLRAVAIDASGAWLAAAGDDGVAYTVDPQGAVGSFRGHDGPVRALAFTAGADRLLSGGDDGTLRIWFVAAGGAAVEPDVRGAGDDGHPGGVLAILVLPGAKQVGAERIVTAGAEGLVRLWRFEQKRRSRKVYTGRGGVWALATAARRDGGVLFAGGDERTVFGFPFDAAGAVANTVETYPDGFEEYRDTLDVPADAKRIAAVSALVGIPEQEALDLVLEVLAEDGEAAVRAHAAREIAEKGRAGGVKALRASLEDDDAKVRAAAFAALQRLEPSAPLSPVRAALASSYADARKAAVELLPSLVARAPLAAGLVLERLADPEAVVRWAAWIACLRIEPEDSLVPVREGFRAGSFADVKANAVAWLALRGATRAADAPWTERALDDSDPTVRGLAFSARVLVRPPLARWLNARDPGSERALADLARRAAEIRGALAGRPVQDTDITAVRAQLLPDGPVTELTEVDREPLLAALACRTPDTSLRGATGLAMLGDLRALGALLTASRDADPNLRRNATLALSILDDPRARRRLVWLLNDDQSAVRDAAWTCLGRVEPDPLLRAEMALRAAQQDIRQRGLALLVEHGQGAPRGGELLADALDDEAPGVRSEAFRTLWAWHPADPLVPIDRARKARFADVRLRAVHELVARVGPVRADVLPRLLAAISDRDADVAKTAYAALLDAEGKGHAPAHRAALASSEARVKIAGAEGSVDAAPEEVRDPLVRLLQDDDGGVRRAALDALDALFPTDPAPIRAGLAVSHLDTRVRAAELLAARRDEALVDPMFALLRDEDLVHRHPPAMVAAWRLGAASALATLGLPRLMDRYAAELVGDDDGSVREQGARGIANACPPAEADRLDALLGHLDIAVRSWAAEGLARLGDARGLPVLVGTLKHPHPPIRVGAVLALAALGTDGAVGLLQGLEDPAAEVQRILFVVLLARDLVAYRRGEPPDLLSAALSAARAETRFAAARAIELRGDPARYLAHLVEVLQPDRPERAVEMARWPEEAERERLLVGLAFAVAGEIPEQRYAALQALRLRDRPVAYFREAGRVARLRSAEESWVPETTPRTTEPPRDPFARLRRLFAGSAGDAPAPVEDTALFRVALGAYIGLVRQPAADDEGHRVKRDAIERIATLVRENHAPRAAAVPALARALDDANHLVRRAAFSALKAIHDDAETPLTIALSASAADVLRSVLDDLARLPPAEAFPRVARALDSPVPEARRYAFDVLERISARGSLDPLLACLRSAHADMRIGVIERLASSQDPRVTDALGRALQSDHDDLRIRAAELLAARKDDRAVDVLDAALRNDEQQARARAALVRSASDAAVRALAGRLGEEPAIEERLALIGALGDTRNAAAIVPLVARFADEAASARLAALTAGLHVAGPKEPAAPVAERSPGKRVRDAGLALRVLEGAARCRDAEVRAAAAGELDMTDHSGADGLLVGLFGDRDRKVRVAAVSAYAQRVEKKGADPQPLDEVLRGGARDTMLPAARGLAARQHGRAFLPLLLFVRAGADEERPQAVLGLGALGDLRALPELEALLDDDEVRDAAMKRAALEALGNLFARISDGEARERVRDRIEAAFAGPFADGAVRGLAYIGGERARARIERVIDGRSKVPQVQVEACAALGRLKDGASEPALARALASRSPEVRQAALRALREVFPSDRTRVELHAVACGWDDVARPAANFLASEGDASAILPVLEQIEDDSLRQRLRFGLMNRGQLAANDLTAILRADRSVNARSDAAWLVAARSGRSPWAGGDRAALAGPVSEAVKAGASEHAAHLARGEGAAASVAARAWVRALWAARRIGAPIPPSGGRDVPLAVRIEAAHAVGEADASRPLASPDPAVRFAAAAAVGAAALERAPRPLDPVAIGQGRAPAGALATPAGRQAYLPAILRGMRDGSEAGVALIERARAASGAERLDAIAALGLAGGAAAAELLAALSRAPHEPEDVRKAAFRAAKRLGRRNRRAGGPGE